MLPNKLTKSERVFVASVWLTVASIGLLILGGLVCFPWIVGGIGVFLVWRAGQLPKPHGGSGVHGTAHFGRDEEIAGWIGGKGLILGSREMDAAGRVTALEIVRASFKGVAKLRSVIHRHVSPGGRELIRLPVSDKFSHAACYLASGVGKTFHVLIPNLLKCDENAVVYDPSGAAYNATAAHRKKKFGHDIRLIDPFGICRQKSDRFNPMDLAGKEDPGGFDYCRNLARASLPEPVNGNQDPFWHSASITATEFVLYATLLTAKGILRSVRTVGEFLSPDRFHDLAEGLSDHPDESLRRRALQMAGFQGRTLQSLLACMTAGHGWMDSPKFSGVLSESTFSVRDLFRKKMTLFIVIPGNRVAESQPFVRMLLSSVLFAAFENRPDIHRPIVRFYLDELATLGKLDELMTLYTQGRKYGLRSVNFFQSVGQVSEIMGSPEKVHTFRSNMSAELFKAKDFQTAREVSEWIGQTTVQSYSASEQEGTNSGWSISHGNQTSQGRSGGRNQGYSLTMNETGVPAIRPEQVLQLREDEAIVLSAGIPPIRVNIVPAENRGVSYLFRVRCHALANLLIFVPSLLMLAAALFVAGALEWKQQPEPAFDPLKFPMFEQRQF